MSLLIRFTKMHGLGNDFVLLDNISQFVPVNTRLVRQLADRHTGIGCDQVLVLDPPQSTKYDFFYRIYNADGTEVEQCGNGARCVAQYVRETGYAFGDSATFETIAKPFKAQWSKKQPLTVEMGMPGLAPHEVPIRANRIPPHSYNIRVNHEDKTIHAVSMGNPHCIVPVARLEEAPVDTLGQALQSHDAFPHGVNVTFSQVLARNNIKIRTYERGVGETQACGSGACAAVVAHILNQECGQEVRVDCPGGHLTVMWPDPNGPVLMQGPTATVYRGEFVLSKL